MSTTTGTVAAFNVSSSANLQAWATPIQNLLNANWTQTSDTGQSDFSTITLVSGVNTPSGYRIYKMADSLQSTYPVYMKIEVGEAASSSFGAVWLTFGTGSDGAGNITGVFGARTQYSVTAGGSAGTTTYWGSAGSARFWIYFSGQGGASLSTFLLSIERAKDASGNDTGGGLLLTAGRNSAGGSVVLAVSSHTYIPFTGAAQPVSTNLIAFVPSGATWADGTSIGVCPVRYANGAPTNPGLNMLVYLTGDTTAQVTVSVSVYGTAHTYLPLGAVALSTAVPGNANASLMMRYE